MYVTDATEPVDCTDSSKDADDRNDEIHQSVAHNSQSKLCSVQSLFLEVDTGQAHETGVDNFTQIDPLFTHDYCDSGSVSQKRSLAY